MTATDDCELLRLAVLHPTLTDEELRQLAAMGTAGAGDDPDD